LRKVMPKTYATFLVGSIALAGIFPFAGFWSKDEILANAGHDGYKAFLIVGIIGAFLTAAYMTRCVWLTFHGEYRGGHEAHDLALDVESAHLDEDQPEAEHGEPHESNWILTMPLFVLSAFALVIGLLNFPHWARFERWFEPKDLTGFESTL